MSSARKAAASLVKCHPSASTCEKVAFTLNFMTVEIASGRALLPTMHQVSAEKGQYAWCIILLPFECVIFDAATCAPLHPLYTVCCSKCTLFFSSDGVNADAAASSRDEYYSLWISCVCVFVVFGRCQKFSDICSETRTLPVIAAHFSNNSNEICSTDSSFPAPCSSYFKFHNFLFFLNFFFLPWHINPSSWPSLMVLLLLALSLQCKRTLSNILCCVSCECSGGTWKNINSYIRLTST